MKRGLIGVGLAALATLWLVGGARVGQLILLAVCSFTIVVAVQRRR